MKKSELKIAIQKQTDEASRIFLNEPVKKVNCKHCNNTDLQLNESCEAHCNFCGNWSNYSELNPNQQNNNTIDMQNESLEDAYKKWASLNKDGAMNGADFRLIQAGANWQQQKDKAVVDKLIEALKMLLPIIENECTLNGICLEIRYQTEYLKAKQLLQSIEKETI